MRSGVVSGTAAMALLAALAPLRLAAQPSASKPPAAPAPMRGPSLFISPAGQPFRSPAGQPYPVVRWFAQVDKTGDGRIDRAEFRADAEAFFRTLDTNHDGVIDPFELQTYENQVVPEILGAFRVPGADHDGQVGPPVERPGPRGLFGRRKPPPDPAAASVADGAAPFELIPDPEPVEAADLAMDGHITLAEYMTVIDRRFDRLDKKRLGYLTLADLPKPLAQTAGEAPAGAAAGSSPGHN
jgi:hypothetical protein